MDIEADTSYLEHELRAFDRAFDTLPPALKPQANAVSGETERRMRPRFVGPDFGALQEQAKAWNAVYDALEKVAPGWREATPRAMTSAVIAIENLAARAAEPNREQIRTNMLADTADEALRIINDAGLLKNLVEIFTMRDPGTTVKIYESSRENAATPWCLNVHEEGQVARHYRSTSLHQLIEVAHKGERDLHQPEHEECKFCGFTVETPCDAPPPAECPTAAAAQLSEAMLPVTKTVGGRPLAPKPTSEDPNLVTNHQRKIIII